ncbi:3,4-dihydroxy-2-butanone-4-phosphate synthase [Anaplasma phagocytophilum]|uniref:3,4-dihydroxy-2-butanone-4-phosphate synthase n=1 Tax=Anaplasma phagocytophilum TaxID=948 RepID=UPI0031F85DCE
MAGAAHAAVICELINPDGSRARLTEIMEFASANGIKVTKKCTSLTGFLSLSNDMNS